MAGFQFRLQSVEKVRTRNRDAAAEAVRQAQEAIFHLNDQILQLQAEMKEQSDLQGQSAIGIIQTQRVLESQRYQLHLLGQVRAIEDRLALIQQEYQRRQKILVEREAELKALERMRDAQFEQWQQTQLARAQNRLDEWSGYRYWANRQTDNSHGE